MCLFLTLPSPTLVLAQEKLLPVFHFNRLTAPDTLPTSDMLARICRDSKGFVWIGTENGLSRYDGYGFKHYRNISDDSSSLPSNAIIMVKEDSHKRLWVGTFDAGLSLYDPDRDCFVNFRPRPGDSTWLQTRIVLSMTEDSSGVLWLGTGLSGIVRVDIPETAGREDYYTIMRGVRFTSYPLGTRDNAGYDIAVRRDGRILVASDSGLLVLDRNTGSVSRPDLPGRAGRRLHSVLAYRLALDHEVNLWVGTNEGLFKINWENGTVLNYRHNKDDSLSITWDDIQDLAVDRRGSLWLASAQGVDLFSPGTGKRVPYLTSGQTPQGSAAMALSVDNTGTVWMNSATEGVFRLSEKSRRLLHYSIRQPDGAPRKLESIERSPDGTFWISARGRLFRLNIHALQVMESIDVTHGAKLRGDIPNKKRTCLAKDGHLWYGTWGPGLFEVDLVKRKVRNYRYPNPLETESNIVMALGRGSGDSLWIAALHDGLMSFDPISGTFTRVLFGRDRRAFEVTTDRAGKVWLATQGSGLYVLDPATGAIDHLVHDVSDPRSLSHDRTLHVFEDPSGRIWVSAVNVINLWDPQSRSFLRYSNPAFPNANSVDVVGADRKGRLWVSYDGKELAALDPSTGLFINFDPSDGAAGGGIDMENLDDGRVLLTGSGGMNIFHPDSVLDIHRTPPPLVLTRMAINDRPVVLPASAGGSVQQTRSLCPVPTKSTASCQ